jgi:hypothetical protein
MFVDPVTKVCFVGDTEGNIKVVDLGKVPESNLRTHLLVLTISKLQPKEPSEDSMSV